MIVPLHDRTVAVYDMYLEAQCGHRNINLPNKALINPMKVIVSVLPENKIHSIREHKTKQMNPDIPHLY